MWKSRILLVTGLVSSIFCCALIQTAFLRYNKGKSAKGESNYFSSLARVQNAAMAPARIALVGSSITARLPDRSQNFDDVVNLGIDGGCALDGLQLLCDQVVVVTDVVVVEVNTLAVGLHSSSVSVSDQDFGKWFVWGAKFPLLSYQARPSSQSYMFAKNVLSHDSAPIAESWEIILKPEEFNQKNLLSLENLESTRVDQLCHWIEILQQRGLKVVMLQYPPASGQLSKEFVMAENIARRCSVPLYDLGKLQEELNISFTDSVHMTSASAIQVSQLLRQFF